MYIRKDTIFENSIEREEYHDGKRGAPGQKRGQKKKLTKEEMAETNRRQKRKRAARLIKHNFQKGDYWSTFTYRTADKPRDMEGAKADFQNLIRAVKKRFKKADQELKYWGAIEIGKHGGIHLHIILSRIEGMDKILQECWTKGGIHNELMYEDSDGGFRQLVEYLLKVPGEENPETGKKNGMVEKWESRSRNLEEPPVKKKIIASATYRQGANIPKGYYLDKDSLREGFDKFTGYKYRSYTLIQIQEQTKRRLRI